MWFLMFVEKIKEGSVHAFNKKQNKQDHYGPLTMTKNYGTPLPSNCGNKHNDNIPELKKVRE